jgi:hypothetical protein
MLDILVFALVLVIGWTSAIYIKHPKWLLTYLGKDTPPIV